MSHYFVTPQGPARLHPVRARLWGREVELDSSPGVFSQHRLDLGTSVLLRTVDPPPDRPSRLLDLGCGFGPIAVALALACPQACVDAVDVNLRAVELTAHNAARLGLADRMRAMTPSDADPAHRYDEIWSNPPIRVGKQALHELLLEWLGRLAPEGVAHLVVGKNLGADSLQGWLVEQGWDALRVGSAKGFRVFDVRRALGGAEQPPSPSQR
ncbi:Methyltransferase small domain-containing protein [Propionibacterium cyclohexanicum]|uniref:Methyltransferase small domain-containing protein n=1 Tax=Propionibacterium cyclohexanicum TaxID=64702 RepID=A0A1H9S7P1_9ACTN|nr:methyltransferase [Propionibacterium cyclohexanicum]SER80403.1 Methyltransferase small domain-containing protein [Propionibacterium cyclohexanicum]